MDCKVSVASQSLGFLTLKIQEYFEFCPDWYHRNPAVGELVMQYYVVLRSLLRFNPTLRRCLCRCRHCQIFFLSHPRNAERRDLACPFGCRRVQRRQSSNRRSLEYYRSPKGREKKRLHNQRRGSPRPSLTPTLRIEHGSLISQAETFDSGMMRYLQMEISLIEGQPVSEGEILRIPTRVVRQHSITRRRRIDHVLRSRTFNLRPCEASEMAFLLTFLFGCVDGLRCLTPPALVCWAAHLGWLGFAGTKLAFINYRSTLIVFTLLAVVELIADKLPNTPARTAPLGLIARICLGGACGLGLATSAGINLSFSVLLASIGALVGAFGGYHSRRSMVSKAHVPDLAVAVAEDAIAIAGGLLILSHVGQ